MTKPNLRLHVDVEVLFEALRDDAFEGGALWRLRLGAFRGFGSLGLRAVARVLKERIARVELLLLCTVTFGLEEMNESAQPFVKKQSSSARLLFALTGAITKYAANEDQISHSSHFDNTRKIRTKTDSLNILQLITFLSKRRMIAHSSFAIDLTAIEDEDNSEDRDTSVRDNTLRTA